MNTALCSEKTALEEDHVVRWAPVITLWNNTLKLAESEIQILGLLYGLA